MSEPRIETYENNELQNMLITINGIELEVFHMNQPLWKEITRVVKQAYALGKRHGVKSHQIELRRLLGVD